MALQDAGQPAAERHSADPAATAATAAAAAGSDDDRRVQQACCVRLDAEGNVLSHVPALVAAAVERLIEGAAAADTGAAARGEPRAFEFTRLHGIHPPGISVDAYAARLLRYCKCSPVCYVAAFAYISRLQRGVGGVRGGPLRCDALTAHRLMAVGTVIATKFYDDKYYSNTHYAQVAGVSLVEWNLMELDMLFRLNFRARVDSAELAATLAEMEALAAGGRAAVAASALLRGLAPEPAAVPTVAAERQQVLAERGCAVTVAAALAAAEDASVDTTVTAPHSAWGCAAESAAQEEEREELRACAASAAPLPWAAADAGAASAAEAGSDDEDSMQHTSPPRRSKKRCSIEAAQFMPGLHEREERQRLAEAPCRA